MIDQRAIKASGMKVNKVQTEYFKKSGEQTSGSEREDGLYREELTVQLPEIFERPKEQQNAWWGRSLNWQVDGLADLLVASHCKLL